MFDIDLMGNLTVCQIRKAQRKSFFDLKFLQSHDDGSVKIHELWISCGLISSGMQ